jgi:hypothetical protein
VTVRKEMGIRRRVVNLEMIVQLSQGINKTRLSCAVDIFTDFGALGARNSEHRYKVTVAILGLADVGALNVDCRVEAVNGGNRELAYPY